MFPLTRKSSYNSQPLLTPLSSLPKSLKSNCVYCQQLCDIQKNSLLISEK